MTNSKSSSRSSMKGDGEVAERSIKDHGLACAHVPERTELRLDVRQERARTWGYRTIVQVVLRAGTCWLADDSWKGTVHCNKARCDAPYMVRLCCITVSHAAVGARQHGFAFDVVLRGIGWTCILAMVHEPPGPDRLLPSTAFGKSKGSERQCSTQSVMRLRLCSVPSLGRARMAGRNSRTVNHILSGVRCMHICHRNQGCKTCRLSG